MSAFYWRWSNLYQKVDFYCKLAVVNNHFDREHLNSAKEIESDSFTTSGHPKSEL